MDIEHIKLKIVILAVILIIVCFGFGKEVLATDYYATGTLVSTNLLEGRPNNSIDSFFTSSTIPDGTSLWIQFATTSSSEGPWYNKSSELDATTSISAGATTTNLSGDICSGGANFYYKMQFNSNAAATSTPVLDEIRVNYSWSYTLGTGAEQTINVAGYLKVGDGVNEVTVTGATYNPVLNIDGNLTISTSSILIAPTSSLFTIAGNWTNNGTFTHSDGTVTFDGPANSTSTIYNSNTFYNLNCTTSDKNIVFEKDATTTVEGTLTLTGTSGHEILLRSSSSTAWWYLTAQATTTVSYVNVQDSNASSSAAAINDVPGGIDSGNNPNWLFPAEGITISGHAYDDEGTDPIDGSGTNKTVNLRVNGAGSYTDEITTDDGAWEITPVTVDSGNIITVYLDGETEQATMVYVSDGTAQINVNLYKNRVLVRADTSSITNANLLTGDDGDPDIKYNVSGSNLTVDSGFELYIWTGDTFAPGGNVTITPGGSEDIWDGSLKICSTSTFTGSGTSTYSIGGSWIASSTAVFTSASSTVTFTATTTGKTITTAGNSFYNLTFNGSGGEWTFQDAITADGNLTMTAGTLTGSQNITVNGGNATGTSSGTITLTGGTFTLAGTGSFGVDTALWTFNNLTFGSGSSATTSKIGTGNIKVNGVLTITASQVLQASSEIWELTSSSTPFVISGIFLAQDSLFKYTSAASTTISTTTYDKLELSPSAAGSPIYTIQSGTLTTNDYLYIGDTSNAVTVTANTNDPTLDIVGDFEIRNSATFTASDSGGFSVGGSWSNAGTFTHSNGTVVFDASSNGKTVDPGDSSFYKVDFNNASGGWTIVANATSTDDWKITTSTSFAATSSITIEVKGNYDIATSTPSITDWQSGSTLYLNGTSQTVGNKSQAAEKYANLDIGGDADIRMWNSYAATTTIVSTGSLYSMDYDEAGDETADDGKLFIWGGYHTQAYDYWSYNTDFDGASVSRQCQVTINSGASITVDNGDSLEIRGWGTSSDDISIVSASASWDLNNNGTTTIQEATINYLNPATGTITVLNTTLNNEGTPDAGATLNVDWYLGAHVVDANSTSTDVPNATTTISSTSTSDNTIWMWSGSGWGDASTTQVTVTYATGTATGTIPQPETDGAVRIREYSATSTGNTYYKYNLAIMANGFSDYNYFSKRGGKYISSTSSSDEDVDACISEDWQRDDIDVNNDEQTLNGLPTTGTWYAGMDSDLEFGVNFSSVDLSELNTNNNFTATGTTITYVTTTAGYLITAWAANDGKLTATSSPSIIRWPYNNVDPHTWESEQYGFGYTTNDTYLSGGLSGSDNRFATSTKYAGFATSSAAAKPVADRPNDGTSWQGQPDTITYKVSVSETQAPDTYNTTITYVCTAQY